MSISSERRWYFSSESVTEGHPDKVADAISDSVLDAVLVSDPEGRVACEALVTKRRAIVAGEITSNAKIDIEAITRKTIAGIGYDGFDEDFDAATIDVEMLIQPQSPDIAEGVNNKGAGDQGIMFGFAVDETPELMPVPIQLAHRLAERLTGARLDGSVPYLRPDGKTQVMVQYEGRRPVRVTKILISAHHAEGVDLNRVMRPDLVANVIERVVPVEMLDELSEADILVNPTGRFVTGGPVADTGLTGRKVIVDTYGGYARHGGGAFSGKDPTKVDRSAAYAARHAAKNVVAAGLAAKCEVQLAYAIGVEEPFSIHVETFGTEQIDPAKLERLIGELFDFRPMGIIERLDLRRPIYRPTAAYGHFGRPSFTWEAIDYAELLAAEARNL